MKDCCDNICTTPVDDKYRKILWIALILNLSMFFVEVISSYISGSVSLFADALDFLGDSSNYIITLFVLNKGMRAKSKAAILKALCMLGFSLFVICRAFYSIHSGLVPTPEVMGIIGFIALAVNGSVAFMLYKFRTGDSSMQSVWLCSRNDAIANIAVIIAGAGVFATNSNLPDLAVAIIIVALGLSSAIKILKKAKVELRL